MTRFLLVAMACAVALQLLIPPSTAPLYLSAAAMAAAAPWLALRWYRPAVRFPWQAMGLAFGLVAAGDLWYVVVSPWLLDRPDPVVSLADLFYLVGYGISVVALVALTRTRRPESDLDLLLDGLALTVASLVAVVPSVVLPAADDGATSVEVAVNIAYPLVDVVLIGALLRLVGTGAHRSPSGVLIGAGLFAWFLGDLGYAASFAEGYTSGGGLVDVTWTVSYLAVAAGLLHPSMRDLSTPAAVGPSGSARRRLLVSVASVGAVTLLLLAAPDGTVERPGRWFWAAVVVVLIGIVEWRVLRLFAARQRADAEVRRTIRYFQALAANSSDALLAIDADGRIHGRSPGLAAVLGRDDDEFVGKSLWGRVHPDDQAGSRQRFARVLTRPGEVIEGELRVIGDDGEIRWITTRMVNLLDDSDVGRVIVNVDDVTARRRAEEELERHLHRDHVTGLANRTGLRRRLQLLDNGGLHDQTPRSLLLIDLDAFATVNERFGYDVGDHLLTEVGEALSAMTRAGDVVARIGGDEFAVLMSHSRPGSAEARSFAARVLERFASAFRIEERDIVVGVSIGIAEARVAADPEMVLRDAVVAVQEAKVAGKGRIVVFEDKMRHAASERLRLETDLVGAIERGELELHYQPILTLDDGRIRGFEALLRWHHPRLGLVPPDRFIPLAEGNGLIVPIGAWVVDQACAQLSRWRQDGHLDLHVAVNVSGRQLGSDQLVPTVAEALERHRLPASGLTVEITETALVEDPVAGAGRLRELGELGLTVAIDDFGTGYSSLSYLRQFPVDLVKIDRSFVNLIDGGSETPPLVRGVLELAHTLGLATLAEGIEEETQLTRLRAEGCALGQGYLFSRPVPAAEATVLLGDPARISSQS